MPFNDSQISLCARFILFLLVALLLGGMQLNAADATVEMEEERESMKFSKIGIIHSPYSPELGAPRQGGLAPDTESTIVVDAEYAAGLQDIEAFKYIIVLYAFNRSNGWKPIVYPPWEDAKPRGVFASRSPRRPNPIGMTVVRLVRREGATLYVKGLDAFDGTPVLDLKPYVPRFDCIDHSETE